jgi:CDP-diacylglycerol--glycerol-3-phosphate 3-phosphatidyltransferase
MSERPRASIGDLAAPPNLLTLARLALVPVALALLVSERRTEAVIVLLIMVATDGLDGLVARRTGRVTELGKILDPVADKVAIDAILTALTVRGEFPAWALALVLARDAGILIGAAAVARRGTVPAALWVGKVALVILAAMTVTFVADLTRLEGPLLAAGAVSVVVSGAWYAAVVGRVGRRQMGSAQRIERE